MPKTLSSLKPDARPARQDLLAWFESPLGTHVLNTEVAMLDQLLPGFFGYNLLQLSVQNKPLYASSTVQTKIPLAFDETALGSFNQPGSEVNEKPVMASPSQLPFESDSVDVAILHHLLDFAESPQDILKELARVTLPMGHIVIVGFNPWSLWGLWRAALQFKERSPWNGRYIGPGRLMDWLNLLDFKIDRAQYAIYRPPVTRLIGPVRDYSQGVSRNLNLPVGGIYVIVARKHIGSVRSIKPVWKTRRAFGRLSAVPNVKHDGLTRVEPPEQD